MDHLSFFEYRRMEEKAIAVLPIAMGIGSDVSGTAGAPQYLVNLGIQKALQGAGFKARVLPEIQVPVGEDTKEARLMRIAKTAADARDVVRREILTGNKVLALGGDHAISIGTIAGVTEAISEDLGVIWIDAHADMNTYENSTSKNVHGMVASAVLGFGDSRLTGVVAKKIRKENFLAIGLKDLDQTEIDFIRKEKITTVTMMDIVANGFSAVFEAMKSLERRTKKVWVSLDMDSIDEHFAPASAMATKGGLTYREATNLLTYLGKTFDVVGMDVVEIVPEKDVEQKTARLAFELVAAGFGSRSNWYSEYMGHYKAA